MLAIAQPRRRAARRALVLAFPSGRVLLGVVPPDSSFADLVLPASSVSSRAGFRQVDRQGILSALQSGYIPVYSPCSGQAPTMLKVSQGLQAAGKMALDPKLLASAGPAAPFVAIGGTIAEVLGSIFGGHAAAVGREQEALCQAVPAANTLINQVDQAFAAGQVNAQQAATLLDQVMLQFEQGVSPIIKMSSTACNAACVYLRILQAIIAKRKAQYADRAATSASTQVSSSTAVSTAASSGSNLLPWAAAALLLLLLKGGI